MSAAENPFEDLMRLGMDMAKAMGPEFDKFAPTFPAEMLEGMMGKTFNPEGLDAKTRLLMTLMGLTVLGAQAEPQIRLTVKHAVEAGASQQELAETVAMAAMFGGAAAMPKAMGLVGEALKTDEEGA